MNPPSELSRASSGWVVSWSASVQGPYPSGNAAAQPDMRLAFPVPAAGARDQSFRLVVKPELWGSAARMRFSNALGLQPVSFAGAFIGMHQASSAVLAGTNRRVGFGGCAGVTVPAGESAWSDPVELDFIPDPDAPDLAGRKLALSFHVAGESGPMTWHAKALQTSYLSFPGAGAHGHDEGEGAFPLSTSSCFFLDALEMLAPAPAYAIVALGDSITDGSLSTLNGDDRWPDVLARRLRAVHGNRIAVVNAGIGGNQVISPRDYSSAEPFPGGPSALARLQRDVLSLSGVGAVIWLEGINDFSRNGNASVEAVCAGLRDGVHAMRTHVPGVNMVGGTVTTALNAAQAHHGFREEDEKRRALNEFIRTSGLYDHVADFDAAITDPRSGEMRAEFVHNTTVGGPGDKLHPNRLGYLAMGAAIDIGVFDQRSRPK